MNADINGKNKKLTEMKALDSWRNWCRLCAKIDPLTNTKVYSQNEQQTWNSVLATAIGKYFWVNIKVEDELSNVLCTECHCLVDSLISFTDHVQKVQAMFNVIYNTNPKNLVDPNGVRQQYGMLQSNFQHIIKPQAKEAEDIEFIDEKDARKAEIEAYDDSREHESLLAEIEEEAVQSMIVCEDEFISEKEAPKRENIQLEREINPDEQDIEEVYDEEVEEGEEEDDSQWTEYATEQNSESEETGTQQQSHTLERSSRSLRSTTTLNKNRDDSIDAKCQRLEDQDDILEEIETEECITMSVFCCSICNKCYRKPKSYKKHMQEEHKVEPDDLPNSQCEKCNLEFPTESELQKHLKMHRKEKEKTNVTCKLCEKVFTTLSGMKRHYENTHVSHRPFICDCCGKALKTLAALNEHKLVHTDECPFECEVCHGRFKTKARLKIHSEIHGSSSYTCNLCGLKLNTKRTFNMHKLVHSEEKQYKCTVCDAAFKRAKTLKAHLILHTGLRPYVCNFCGKTFSNGSNCRMHKRKTHPDELAEEESQGTKVHTKMPLLKELRAVTKEIVQPRRVVRTSGGTNKVHVASGAREKTQKKLNHHDNNMEEEDDSNIVTCIEVVGAEHSLNSEAEGDIICEIVDGI